MPNEHRGTPIVVTHDGSARFSARVRSHRVVVDQPTHAGGADTGPMPLELLGVSLGTCIAYYVHKFLQAREIAHEGMRVEVHQTTAKNPYRVAQFAVHLILPAALPPDYSELLERVVRSCPAHNTLAGVAGVTLSIRAPEAALIQPSASDAAAA
jgi:uncharacterized OsmC-like protein